MIQGKNNFNFSWQTQTPIKLSTSEKYYLQFYLYYNCWETKYFFQFFTSDCYNVVDKLTIYMKGLQDTEFKIFKEFNFNYYYSSDKWNKINIGFDSKSKEYNVIFS